MQPLLQNNGAGGPTVIKLSVKTAAQNAAVAAAMANPAPWANVGATITISQANYLKLYKNFTNAASISWNSQSLIGTQSTQSVGITLNNICIKYGNVISYTGPAIAGGYNPIASLTGLAWALSKGYLVISAVGAAQIQSNDAATGVIPPSFWEAVGKPLTVIAATVAGAALIEGAAAGTSAAASGTAGATSGASIPATTGVIADTSGADASVAALAPVDASVGASGGVIGGALPALAPLTGFSGATTVASGASAAATAASAATQTAPGLLESVGASLLTNPAVINKALGTTGTATPITVARSSLSSLPMLLLFGAAAIVLVMVIK
ncbi:MAG: hypothetical protein WBR15_10860 [Gammaproteobacteria bacterium]